MKSKWGRRIIWLLAVLVSMLGVWVSFVLTVQHSRIAFERQRAKYVEAFKQVRAEEEGADASDKEDEDEEQTSSPTTQASGSDDKELKTALAEMDTAEGKASFLEDLCGAFKTSSCEDVAVSEWGEVKVGGENSQFSIPTSELGMFYFLAVAAWLLLIGQVSVGRYWYHLLISGVAALGLGVSIYLDYVMFTQVDKWCPLCFVTHVASLLLFIFILLLWPRQQRAGSVWLPVSQEELQKINGQEEGVIRADVETGDWPPKRMVIVTAVVILLAIGSVHLYLVNRNSFMSMVLTRNFVELQKTNLENAKKSLDSYKTKLKRAEYYKDRYKKHYQRFDSKWQHTYMSWSLMPQVEIETEGEPFRGPADAPHTIVEYSDFGCPACAKFEKHLERISKIAEPHGGVKIIFKHWPISTDGCNPHAYNDLHPNACDAAYAAEAARILGGSEAFWKMHDILYANKTKWRNKPALFLDYAKQIGLDVEAFKKAMDSEEAEQRVRDHVEEGVNLGKGTLDEEDREWVKVNATPTVFVDGKRLLNTRHVKTWKMIFRSKSPKEK